MSKTKPRRGGQGRKWHFRVYDQLDLAEATRSAIGAARYHWHGMRHHLAQMNEAGGWKEGGVSKKGQQGYNNFYHHLRAFFWELTAAFDTLLQLINRKYELSLEQRDVRWDTVSKALSERPEHKKLLKRLDKGYNSTWFTDIREYRNFAHRGTVMAAVWAFPPDPVDPAEGDAATLISVILHPVGGGGRGGGEPIAMCKRYGSNVQTFIREVLDQIGDSEATTGMSDPKAADFQAESDA